MPLWCAAWLALGAGILAASPAHAENWAEKMFAEKSHDFRTVGRGTACEYLFEFTNPYQEDVHVAAVRTSCGCTTPTVRNDTVTTHQNGAIITKFNTETHVGEKSAVVTVVFDQPSYAEVRLKVHGHIRTDISFDPPEVDFGQFDAGTPREKEVVITHSGSRSWRITDIRSHCDHLRVKLSDAETLPGGTRYRMTVSLDESAPEGDLRHRMTLISNDRQFPTTEMSIRGQVRPLLAISPSAIGMGTLGADAEASKRLVVRGKEPFAILGAQCADERFSFDLPEGKKKVHVVTMNYTGDGSTEPVSQQVELVSDLPGERTATCVVTAVVR